MDEEQYAITVEGHSLYGSIGFGLKTINKPLAILTAEALGNFKFDCVQVWKLDDGLGGLNNWKLIGTYRRNRWHNVSWSN